MHKATVAVRRRAQRPRRLDTPAARLREAERLFKDFRALTPYPYRPFVKSFTTFEAYERWKRADQPLVPITGLLARTVTIVGDDPRVDVLTIAWTVRFESAYPHRLMRRIQGVRVPYLNRADLIKSKQTGRPQDQADLDRLAPPRARSRSS